MRFTLSVSTFLCDLTDAAPGRVVRYFLVIVEPEYELRGLRTVLRTHHHVISPVCLVLSTHLDEAREVHRVSLLHQDVPAAQYDGDGLGDVQTDHVAHDGRGAHLALVQPAVVRLSTREGSI